MTNYNTITTKLRAILLMAILAIMQVQPVFASEKDSIALVNANWQTLYDEDGVQLKLANCHIFNASQNITVLTFNAREFCMQVGVSDTLIETSRMAESLNADFAINGSFFDFAGPALTFIKKHGRIHPSGVSPEQTSRNNWGLVVADSNSRSVQIIPSVYSDMPEKSAAYDNVLASYPLLLQGRTICLDSCDYVPNKFNNRNPRSLVAIDSSGNVAFFTIDGRAEGKAMGMTLYEECKTALWLGFTDALNLDGGGSTTLWSRTLGVVNYPSDNKKFDNEGERKVSNILYIKRCFPSFSN